MSFTALSFVVEVLSFLLQDAPAQQPLGLVWLRCLYNRPDSFRRRERHLIPPIPTTMANIQYAVPSYHTTKLLNKTFETIFDRVGSTRSAGASTGPALGWRGALVTAAVLLTFDTIFRYIRSSYATRRKDLSPREFEDILARLFVAYQNVVVDVEGPRFSPLEGVTGEAESTSSQSSRPQKLIKPQSSSRSLSSLSCSGSGSIRSKMRHSKLRSLLQEKELLIEELREELEFTKDIREEYRCATRALRCLERENRRLKEERDGEYEQRVKNATNMMVERMKHAKTVSELRKELQELRARMPVPEPSDGLERGVKGSWDDDVNENKSVHSRKT